MAVKLGLNAKLFYGPVGTTAETLMDNVQDVTLSLEVGEADATTRASNGWKTTVATLKEASVEFQSLWDTSDLGFKAIKDAYFSGQPISLFVSDGEGSGLDADWVVTGFSRNEQLTEALTVSVTCKPTLVNRAPVWKDALNTP